MLLFSKLFAKKVEKLFDADASGSSENASTLYRLVLADELSVFVFVLCCYQCVTADIIGVVIKLPREWQLQFSTIVLYLNDLQAASPANAFAHLCRGW